jgi:hypothetical protein
MFFANGFQLGTTDYVWGTTLAEALAHHPPLAADQRSATFAAMALPGLPVLSATIRAPAADRPVLQVWYDMPYDPHTASDAALLQLLTPLLGTPTSQTHHPPTSVAHQSAHVRCVFGWSLPGVHVGVSIFGAPRRTPQGLVLAALYADWEDEIAAAAPFRPALAQADAQLALWAADASALGCFTLVVAQAPFYVANYRASNPHRARSDETLRSAQRCLYKPRLRQTPDQLARQLRSEQVLLWSNPTVQVWGVSTSADTVCFASDEVVFASFTQLAPARGPGQTQLAIDELTLIDQVQSGGLASLVKCLQTHGLALVSSITADDD